MNVCPANVGEDIILPRGTSQFHSDLLGESVPCPAWFHSTEHSETATWREADSLPYIGLYVFWGAVIFLPRHCRGGYHPPAQWGFPILYFVGRIRTVPEKTIQPNTQLYHLAGIYSLPYTIP